MKKKEQEDARQTPSQTELVPLVDKLYTDFSIEALEERLETDPLMLTGLFEEITPYCLQCKKGGLTCSGDDSNCARCNGPGAVYNDSCNCNSVDVDADVDCFKLD